MESPSWQKRRSSKLSQPLLVLQFPAFGSELRLHGLMFHSDVDASSEQDGQKYAAVSRRRVLLSYIVGKQHEQQVSNMRALVVCRHT